MTITTSRRMLKTLHTLFNLIEPSKRSLAAQLLYDSMKIIETQQHIIDKTVAATLGIK